MHYLQFTDSVVGCRKGTQLVSKSTLQHLTWILIQAMSISTKKKSTLYHLRVWLGGWVVRKPDLRSTGRGFTSQLLHCPAQPRASCLHTRASVIKQYNLVTANGRGWSAAGEVTTGLAAYRRVYGFGHLQADYRGPVSALEPYTRYEYGATFTI